MTYISIGSSCQLSLLIWEKFEECRLQIFQNGYLDIFISVDEEEEEEEKQPKENKKNEEEREIETMTETTIQACREEKKTNENLEM